jgi:hypothetical protein
MLGVPRMIVPRMIVPRMIVPRMIGVSCLVAMLVPARLIAMRGGVLACLRMRTVMLISVRSGTAQEEEGPKCAGGHHQGKARGFVIWFLCGSGVLASARFAF